MLEDLNREYLEAVSKDDLETAKKLVAKVARIFGYNYDGYHGTDSKTFTVFKPHIGIYLAKMAVDESFSPWQDETIKNSII